jgi:signal peptidase II
MPAAIFFAAAFFLADRLIKILFLKYYYAVTIPLIGDFLSLKLAANSGIAFSLPLSGRLVITISFLIILILGWIIIKQVLAYNGFWAWPLNLIFFGAVSNFIDRARFGQVIDYLDLKYFTIFNLADLMIVSGTLWLFCLLKSKKDL